MDMSDDPYSVQRNDHDYYGNSNKTNGYVDATNFAGRWRKLIGFLSAIVSCTLRVRRGCATSCGFTATPRKFAVSWRKLINFGSIPSVAPSEYHHCRVASFVTGVWVRHKIYRKIAQVNQFFVLRCQLHHYSNISLTQVALITGL